MTKWVTCPDCRGAGKRVIVLTVGTFQVDCTTCGGDGEVQSKG